MVKTALVVEDDAALADVVKEALEGAGLQVMVEKDGDWALKALQRRLPDVLVMDLLLPTVPGLDVLEQLHRMPGGDQVPTILMSGIYKSARHKRQAKEKFGVQHFLDKPFDLNTLIAAVNDVVGLGKGRKSARPTPRHAATRHAAVGDDPLADEATRLERAEVEKSDANFPAEKSVRGNLKHKRFPEVLAQLYRWRATGALLLRRGRIKKIVYLKDGYPVFVKSNLLSECLGRVLVREKMISEAECERSLEILQQGGGKQQGTILIEMGVLSPHNLVFGLQLQLEQKLFDVFSWPDGDYQFNTKVEIPAQAVQLDMSLASVVYEGVRRKFTDAQVRDLLEPFLDLYLGVHPEPSHRFQDLPLEADERTLVALIDGRRTMSEVVERSGLPTAVAHKLVYALLAAEMVQPNRRAARKAVVLDAARPPPLPPSTTSSGASAPPPLPRKRVPQEAPPRPTRAPAGRSAPSPRQGEGPTPATLLDVEGIEDLRARLVERARLLRRQTYFEALGVSQRAAVDEIQRAYFALARDLHPDRLRRAADGGVVPADARALAEQIHHQLTTAFETLSDERRRDEYKARLAQGHRTAVSEELTRLLDAETRYRKGENALDAGEYDDAARAFEAAVALYPEEGEFQASLAWALYQQTPDDPVVQADAITRLQQAVELAPRWDRGWLWLGRVLQRAGRPGEALKQFERALHCNPDNREAQAELKLRG